MLHFENTSNYREFGAKADFLNFADPSFPGFPNAATQNSQRWSNTTALRSTFGASLVNEARFGMQGGISLFGGSGVSEFDNQGGYDLNLSDLGITDATAVATVFGGNLRGGRFFGPTANRRNTPVFNFSDTATWARGNHSFSFGGSYNLINSFIQDLNQLVPSVNFGIAEGDPAENIFFNAANFPGASVNDLVVAGQLYATLTGRVTAIDRYATGARHRSQPKTDSIVTNTRPVPKTISRPAAVRVKIPRTTAHHAVLAADWPRRIAARTLAVVVLLIPILTPFVDVAMHIVQPPVIRLEAAGRNRAFAKDAFRRSAVRILSVEIRGG